MNARELLAWRATHEPKTTDKGILTEITTPSPRVRTQ
jgi:hypothetical protein